MNYRFYITDVFTTAAFGGNQLAVLPEATGLTSEGMQRITREFNFAETTFVLPPDDRTRTCRVRIFTPGAELQFAGHPTVGTACALVHGGHYGLRAGARNELVFEEGVGPVDVVVQPVGQLLDATFTRRGTVDQRPIDIDAESMTRVLGVQQGEVLDIFAASMGVPFCFARLAGPEVVDRARLNQAEWEKSLAGSWASQVFLFAQDAGNASNIYARMFAPALGVAEDPGTGSACAALAGVRAGLDDSRERTASLTIVQGVAMGRRSDIRASATRSSDGLATVSVGGPCVHVAAGELAVPSQWLAP